MLDIGGVLRCRICNSYPGIFQVHILTEDLGIEPGPNFILAWDRWCNSKLPWYIRLYVVYGLRISKNKKYYFKRGRITDVMLKTSDYYNEAVKINEESEGYHKEDWFEQDIKASIILPILLKKSKIPSSLIYKDEYWKT